MTAGGSATGKTFFVADETLDVAMTADRGPVLPKHPGLTSA